MSKSLVFVFVLALAVVVIAACAPAATPTAAPVTTAPTSAPQPTAVPPTAAPTKPPATAGPLTGRGACGDLKILYWQAVTTLNPHLSQGTKDYDASSLVYEPLAWTGADGNPVPALAAEIPTVGNGGVSKDLTTVTWKLKQGVKWSDGTDFTADDVVFTYVNFVGDEKTGSPDASIMDGVAKVEAVDKNTVKVTFKEPNPNSYQLGMSSLNHVLQKKLFDGFTGVKAKDAPGNNKPVGTGPYVVKEFKPDDVVTFEINPNYRDPAKPCFKTITLKGGGDATSAARAVFQTGDVDYAWNLQVEAAVLDPMYKDANSKGVLVTIPGSESERLLLNRTNPDPALGANRSEVGQPHPFLSDLKVRQALKLAIDTKPLAALYVGGKTTCNIILAVPAYDSKNTKCDPDPDQAAKLLDDAGWTKGSDGIRHKTVGGKDVKMKILYQTTVNSIRQKEQALIKEAWEKLGIQVELKQTQGGVFFSSDEANPDTAAKFFADVEMFTNNADQPDPTTYLAGWSCKEIAAKANKWGGSNYERFCSKDYDALLDSLHKEADPAKRADIIIKMNDMLINDVVIIPLVNRPHITSGASKKLQGIVPNPWDTEMWNVVNWTKLP
jgi:peptide/nickel transport system substrate-binding protein